MEQAANKCASASYLYAPPASKPVISLPVQDRVSTGITFPCVLHSQTLSSLQTKRLYCNGEHPRTVYPVTDLL